MKFFLYVWHMSDPQRIIAIAQALQADGLAIKAGDGITVWPQFEQSVQRVRQAGLAAWAWAFCYGNDVAGESRVAVEAIRAGADGFAADMETPYYDGKDAESRLYGAIIRSHTGYAYPLGVTTMSSPRVAPALPWSTFRQWASFLSPQDYSWAYAGGGVQEVTRTYTSTRSYFRVPDIWPSLPLYGDANPAKTRSALTHIQAHNGRAVFFWDSDALLNQPIASPTFIQSIADVLQPFHKEVP